MKRDGLKLGSPHGTRLGLQIEVSTPWGLWERAGLEELVCMQERAWGGCWAQNVDTTPPRPLLLPPSEGEGEGDREEDLFRTGRGRRKSISSGVPGPNPSVLTEEGGPDSLSTQLARQRDLVGQPPAPSHDGAQKAQDLLSFEPSGLSPGPPPGGEPLRQRAPPYLQNDPVSHLRCHIQGVLGHHLLSLPQGHIVEFPVVYGKSQSLP